MTFLMSACDFFGEYYYDVSNETEEALDIEYVASLDTLSLNLLPGETVTIFQHDSGILGRREKPDDFWALTDGPISWLYVSANDSLIDFNFAQRRYWTYKATARKGR